MRSRTYFLSAVVAAISICGSILYTSCAKDACKGTTCLNKSICSGGACVCKPGSGGASCEVIYRDMFAHIYKGTGMRDTSTLYIDNTLTFTSGADSDYTQMQVAWNNFGPHIVTMNVVLSNISSTGATVTAGPVTIDTNTYSGLGNVSSTSASLNITESHPNSPSVTIQLHDFNRQ